MTAIQFIQREGNREYAIVPIDLWERVQHLFEAMEDVRIHDAAVADDDGFRIPAAVLDAQLAGDHPIKAWRDHRRLTQDALANAAGVSKPYLSQIENRKRDGSVDVLRALATALAVPLDLLVEDRGG
ncbi:MULTISPECIES: helix-turn-helix domain-containing protein [unclassified Cupriavidus]|jgi:DNA-binding XRE family transcriptional regulator|uniref:helix-turn-helix domain-containing protein n=1 Tax=unclassified Cupriavidus TaxID=2640874 RepID=UPI001C00348B|nr:MULTISPECIES: helix-turn-helix domain-containing protein [unclassified Cupriavidus]MCA3185662.1 helix-turn-helix transcriptional regulator [Cupriavidus sp.]MCA3194582.1 helix-turn-helix transcriptional regulator [Cupriavidus sp.]MCA3199925.1 helix-turn-helix transcriptional regulator [Cupriavidus sp.]MCA3205563.1 helix-turn-helix transcriptional regulator [Cupriavidus sp.]MCA3205936.1 helix-turn-helix transcriptional regulator [Cupriavidus sp.]